MKIKYCASCWGTGKVPDFWDNDKEVICPHCNGTGKEPPMTNEEWFDGLSTEEKARFFHSIVIRAVQATWDGKKPDFPAYLYDWEEWLKQPHREEKYE